jgi:hypothetical protein
MVHFLMLSIIAVFIQSVAFGADPGGIWIGQVAGRNGEKLDVAFQFKMSKNTFVGVMFGDEFDLPIEDLKVDGDKITFTVTNVNYYSGNRLTLAYSGTVTGREMQLTRERRGELPAGERSNGKQSFTLKRIAP